MTEKLELYHCAICGNLVEVLQNGIGELVCCNQPMECLEHNDTEDKGIFDKHIPVFEKEIDGYKIIVGATKHPMNEEHHIDFIQAISKDKNYVKTKFLNHNDEPELNLKCNCKNLWARALCNIHGLFKGEYDV